MLTLTTCIQHGAGSPSHSIWARKIIKVICIGKEEIELSLFADDMALYVGNFKGSTQKLLELINKINTSGYKINIQNQLCFYALKINYQKEKLGKQSHLQNASKRIKYLGINNTKA